MNLAPVVLVLDQAPCFEDEDEDENVPGYNALRKEFEATHESVAW